MHPRMLAMAALGALMACSTDPVSGPGAPATLAVVSGGTDATGRVILESADRYDTVVVRVTDAQGRAVPDVAVLWTTDEPDAVVTPLEASSDAEGLVRAEWRLSGAPGTWKARATTGALSAAEASFTVTSWSVKHVVAVGSYTCVQSHDDRLWCRESDAAPFTARLGGGTIRALDGTQGSPEVYRRICIVTEAGVVQCAAASGGPLAFAAVPGQDRPFTRLALGSNRTDCALATDGTLHCWGSGQFGLLGDDSPSTEMRAAMGPVTVPNGVVFTDVALGGSVGCALADTGTPWCWGGNGEGIAGPPNIGTVSTPRAVAVPAPLSHIVVPDLSRAACGLDASHRAICWGAGAGLGPTGGADSPPTLLPGATGLRQLLPLQDGFMSVTTDGKLRGWGSLRLGHSDFPGSVSDLPRGEAITVREAYRARFYYGRACLDAVGGLGTVCSPSINFVSNGPGSGELLWTGFVKPAGAN